MGNDPGDRDARQLRLAVPILVVCVAAGTYAVWMLKQGCRRTEALAAQVAALEARALESAEERRRAAAEAQTRAHALEARHREATLNGCVAEYRLESCSSRQRPESFSGEVGLWLSQGAVTEVRVKGLPPPVETCVRRVVKKWTFSPDDGPALRMLLSLK